MFLVEDCFE